MSVVGEAAPEIAVVAPATGEALGSVPKRSPGEVAEIVARARVAQPGWEALGFDGRGRVLRRAQRWVTDHAEEVIEAVVAETGKAYEDAQTAELTYVANALGFWARRAPRYLADERVRSSSPLAFGRKLLVRYEPRGVIGVIGPWNYPLVNAFGDCVPALAAGNSAVLKPSEVTPLSALLMERALRECGLPTGVFQVATGEGETAASLIDEVDMVMFTGSTATGKKVMQRAAETITPVSLELGGKDPLIVLADADLERAANVAVYYAFLNAGQTCISVERVYVEAPVYDEFVRRVVDQVRELRVGAPAGPGSVEVGAVTAAAQLEIVADHVRDALAKGATALTGARAGPGPGRFYEPTVLVDVDHTMSCMTEETFGPTLPIMRVSDAEEAVRLANDSPYGLQAGVCTGDLRRGEAIARRLEAGTVCVNDAMVNYTALELPQGGAKESGIGSRHGPHGIRKYCRLQAILVTRRGPKRDPHMYPYRARRTRLLGRAVKLLYGRGRR